MTDARPAVMSWSGGKDSALALHEALRDPALRVEALLTTVTDEYERVSMHGVRTALLRAQAAALGLPLVEVRIPPGCTNEQYERAMADALAPLRARGIHDCVFGDLFLEDIRAYREAKLAAAGMRAHFPLWGRDTAALAREAVAIGVRAVLVCVDPRQAPAALAGREYDARLLDELPPSVDPCGERGEFHTFVYDMPCFADPIAVRTGEVVEREGFVFCDLLPAQLPAP